MRRNIGIFLASLSIALFVAGCSTNTARPLPTATPTPTAALQSRSVEFFFVGDTPTGFKLFSERGQAVGDGDLTKLALSSLISGKTEPMDPDYSNLWGDGTTLNNYEIDGNTGIVDLHIGKLNVGAEAESRAIDQLLWTASRIDNAVQGITLLVDGKAIESLAGHVDATKPIKLENSYEVLSPLQISSINEGEKISGPITISGEACTFEANVVWTLRRENSVVKKSSTTAKIACPDRSSWSVNLGTLEPGNYSFTVEDFSAKDGSLVAKDDKNFSVE